MGLWNQGQTLLVASHHAARMDEQVAACALLKGLIFDGAGNNLRLQPPQLGRLRG